MTNPFQKDATRISAMTPTEDAPINCFSLGNEISYHIKKCVPGRTLAPSAVAVRQHSTFRASAHPQRSVFFYTIGNEISYRIKKTLPGNSPKEFFVFSSTAGGRT